MSKKYVPHFAARTSAFALCESGTVDRIADAIGTWGLPTVLAVIADLSVGRAIDGIESGDPGGVDDAEYDARDAYVVGTIARLFDGDPNGFETLATNQDDARERLIQAGLPKKWF